jgi:RimJ/RimL family protein N-acetyltransferase
VREAGLLVGTVGLHDRADGRSPALRFAFCPQTRGRGLAREAAGGALRFAHEAAGLAVVYAVARESNIASRTVLGAIGMREAGTFIRDGEAMLVYQSLPGLRDVVSR